MSKSEYEIGDKVWFINQRYELKRGTVVEMESGRYGTYPRRVRTVTGVYSKCRFGCEHTPDRLIDQIRSHMAADLDSARSHFQHKQLDALELESQIKTWLRAGNGVQP